LLEIYVNNDTVITDENVDNKITENENQMNNEDNRESFLKSLS
jgi:hypothetical protein